MLHKPFSALMISMTFLVPLSGCGDAPDAELGGDESSAPFSTTPHEPNHEEITQTALSFLRPELLTALTVANVETDVQFILVAANHFDNCNFTGGSAVVSSNQAAAVQSLNPSDPSPEADVRALVSFARSLHAVQDFYAHSNWVELGGEVLVDDTLQPFPTLSPYSIVPATGFAVVQGPKPKRSALTRDDDAPYPQNAVVTYRAKTGGAPALISGTVDYEPGNHCPRAVAMTHEELNKDRSDLPGKLAQHEAAKALAIMQTRHEWCRLSALTSAAWGEPGALRLASWVADGAAAPDCTTE